ncbi:histone-lysine N-methyltransferase CLF-like protein isoform X1, partial [Tanacetum coccineum]
WSIEKDLEAAQDSFGHLFCRRSLIFDCKLDGCSQELIFLETDIQQKDEKQSQKRQNQARNGKDNVKSKPKSVKVRKVNPDEVKSYSSGENTT